MVTKSMCQISFTKKVEGKKRDGSNQQRVAELVK
jgi:hypothetical protein